MLFLGVPAFAGMTVTCLTEQHYAQAVIPHDNNKCPCRLHTSVLPQYLAASHLLENDALFIKGV
jgi:hypothetical protein